jgi:hypothetical protein
VALRSATGYGRIQAPMGFDPYGKFLPDDKYATMAHLVLAGIYQEG